MPVRWKAVEHSGRSVPDRSGLRRRTPGGPALPQQVLHDASAGRAALLRQALGLYAHAAGLLELTLGAAGHTALGFAAHVPHYLAGAQYPRASIALLNSLAGQTGLQLPMDVLRESAQEADDDIARQLSAEPENLEAVHMLEQQYDDFMARLEHADDQATDISDLDPKDFVDQVERFLAGRENDEDH